MSLLKTKPSWAPNAIPTNRGWTDPVTNEVYVAIGNLKQKLEEELPKVLPIEEIVNEPAPTKVKATKVKKEDDKKKKLDEQTIVKVAESQQLLGEVVEIKLSDKQEDITE